MKPYYFFAFDLGATSGRSILGILENNHLEMEEINRFPNKITHLHGGLYWDLFSLFEHLKEGLRILSGRNIKPDAIGIDSWGVDFVYLGNDGSIMGEPRSYRDPYTSGVPNKFFELLPPKDLYDLTGIQIMDFNTIFQLYAAKLNKVPALSACEHVLFIPDALSYMLSGRKVCEYTIASTGQILNIKTGRVEESLLQKIGLPPSLFCPMVMPGTIVGNTNEVLNRECGMDPVPVVAVAGHDTGSAVVSVPAEDECFAYLSSGTWSLMGIELKKAIVDKDSYELNFTNEGGVEGTFRFLKNITGMWLLERCNQIWKEEGKIYTYEQMIEMAVSVEGFRYMIDPDDPSFSNPEDMRAAIVEFCLSRHQGKPESDADLIRCIFDSLALKYRYVFDSLKRMAPFEIKKLYVIGGGAKNRLMNRFTACSLGISVISASSEATSVGNIMMQAKGIGLVKNLEEIRKILASSVDQTVYIPEEADSWEKAYAKYVNEVLN